MARKNNFTSENIFLYGPQKDKTFNIFKKEGRNSGTCS
jgi:hypothetical protein